MLHAGIATARDAVRIWFTWRRQALICAGAIIVGVGIRAITEPPRYAGTARLVLLPRTGEGMVITSGTDEKRVAPVTIEDLNTEVGIMRSTDVLRETVISLIQESGEFSLADRHRWLPVAYAASADSAQIVEKGVAELSEALSVTNRPLSNLIDITLMAGNPGRAEHVLTRFLDTFIHHRNRTFSIEQGVSFLSAQADTLLNRLEDAEKQLSEYREKYGIVDIELQNREKLNELSSLEEQLKDIEYRIEDTRVRKQYFEAAVEQKQDDIIVTNRPGMPPLLVELDKAIIGLLMKRNAVSSGYTEGSRELAIIQRQIDKAYEQRIAEIGRALESERLEIVALEARRTSLQERVKTRKREVLEFNRKWQEINDLRRRAELHQKNYLLYASKREDARIFSEKTTRNLTNVRIVQSPSASTMRVSPRRTLMMFIALAVAVVGALALPFAFEAFDPRIKNPSDVVHVLGVPLLCTLDEMPASPIPSDKGARKVLS